MADSGKDNLGYIGENKIQNVEDNEETSSKSNKDASASYPGDSEIDDPNTSPIMDVLSADIVMKPFSIAAGSAKIPHSKFNPFRKKSGLLNVLAKQAKKSRIVAKNGDLRTKVGYKEDDSLFSCKYMKDIFISTLNLNWFWIYLLFSAAFLGSWLLFAVVWYIIFLVHEDYHTDANKCVDGINVEASFTSLFLFSLETQHTIGYGGRATTENCEFAIFIMSIQSIIGVIINAAMAGIIFAKFTIPAARKETIIFSKNAAITMRNGAFYLLCRVADLRENSLLEAHVRMVFIKDQEITEEGVVIPNCQQELKCGVELDGSQDYLLLLWPTVISHKIDEDSPLYEMTPQELLSSNFELIVTLEGSVEETGNTIQVRTSYLPNEIFWGHHFDNEVMTYDSKKYAYTLNTNITNVMKENDYTPRISAKQLNEKKMTFKKAAHVVMACNRKEGVSSRGENVHSDENEDSFSNKAHQVIVES